MISPVFPRRFPVFPRCFPGVSPCFPGVSPCFPGVSPVFPRCFPGVSPCFPGVSSVFPRCFPDLFRTEFRCTHMYLRNKVGMRWWKRTESRNKCLAWTNLTVLPLFTRGVLLVRVILESSVYIGEEQNRCWLILYGSCMHEHWQKAASCYGINGWCKDVVECAPNLF